MADQLSRYSKLGDILGGVQPTEDHTQQASYYFNCLQSLEADIILLQTQISQTHKTVHLYEDRLVLLKEQRNHRHPHSDEPEPPLNDSSEPPPTYPCPHPGCPIRLETQVNLQLHNQLVHSQRRVKRSVFGLEWVQGWELI